MTLGFVFILESIVTELAEVLLLGAMLTVDETVVRIEGCKA